jgi:hypothetical protein
MAWYRVNMNFKYRDDVKIGQSMPKFKITVPVANRSQYLARAQHRGLSQTCPDHQMMVVEDGCAHHPPAIIPLHASAPGWKF